MKYVFIILTLCFIIWMINTSENTHQYQQRLLPQGGRYYVGCHIFVALHLLAKISEIQNIINQPLLDILNYISYKTSENWSTEFLYNQLDKLHLNGLKEEDASEDVHLLFQNYFKDPDTYNPTDFIKSSNKCETIILAIPTLLTNEDKNNNIMSAVDTSITNYKSEVCSYQIYYPKLISNKYILLQKTHQIQMIINNITVFSVVNKQMLNISFRPVGLICRSGLTAKTGHYVCGLLQKDELWEFYNDVKDTITVRKLTDDDNLLWTVALYEKI